MNNTAIIIFSAFAGLGILFSMLRMAMGPTAPDRAVAVDTITTTVSAFLVLLAYLFNRYVYLDVSLVYSLLAFVGLVALARYFERGM